MLIFKKEKQVVSLAREHRENTTSCVRGAVVTVRAYLAGQMDEAKRAAAEVDADETRADSRRREIGDLLYSGAYLPAFREDIYQIINAVDEVANAAESCCDFFVDQCPDIPAELSADYVATVDGCLATFMELRTALKIFFKPKGKTGPLREHAQEVGKLESLVDDKESALTAQIFRSSLEIGQKLHLRQAVVHIVRISDRIEDACDQVELVSMKALV